MSVLFVLFVLPNFSLYCFGDEALNAGPLKNYICLQVNNFVFRLPVGQQPAADNRTGGRGGALLKVCFWKVAMAAPLALLSAQQCLASRCQPASVELCTLHTGALP